jgi:hypothetical protein
MLWIFSFVQSAFQHTFSCSSTASVFITTSLWFLNNGGKPPVNRSQIPCHLPLSGYQEDETLFLVGDNRNMSDNTRFGVSIDEIHQARMSFNGLVIQVKGIRAPCHCFCV